MASATRAMAGAGRTFPGRTGSPQEGWAQLAEATERDMHREQRTCPQTVSWAGEESTVLQDKQVRLDDSFSIEEHIWESWVEVSREKGEGKGEGI